MRLYLSSFRLGARPEFLVDLVRRSGSTSPRVAVVANALDAAEPQRRADAVALELELLSSLGLAAAELDLREYRVGSGLLAPALARCAGLWVRGGNAFVLRSALARSGADTAITEMIAADALVYAGYSAGPCVLAPSLRGLEVVDDATAVSSLHGGEPLWDGLGLLDRPFLPHLDSPGHPETERAGRLAASYRRDGVTFWGLRDGQVLVVDGNLADAAVL